MSNIKNLQMWNNICKDARVSISKSLFGLKTTAFYTPTKSIIDARTIDYSSSDGDCIRRIISSPREELADAIGNFHPKEVPNGNYILEIARSRDGKFIAMCLLQFTQLSYEAVTDTVIFENDEALTVNQMF